MMYCKQKSLQGKGEGVENHAEPPTLFGQRPPDIKSPIPRQTPQPWNRRRRGGTSLVPPSSLI